MEKSIKFSELEFSTKNFKMTFDIHSKDEDIDKSIALGRIHNQPSVIDKDWMSTNKWKFAQDGFAECLYMSPIKVMLVNGSLPDRVFLISGNTDEEVLDVINGLKQACEEYDSTHE